jgi:hypothetical protein
MKTHKTHFSRPASHVLHIFVRAPDCCDAFAISLSTGPCSTWFSLCVIQHCMQCQHSEGSPSVLRFSTCSGAPKELNPSEWLSFSGGMGCGIRLASRTCVNTNTRWLNVSTKRTLWYASFRAWVFDHMPSLRPIWNHTTSRVAGKFALILVSYTCYMGEVVSSKHFIRAYALVMIFDRKGHGHALVEIRAICTCCNKPPIHGAIETILLLRSCTNMASSILRAVLILEPSSCLYFWVCGNTWRPVQLRTLHTLHLKISITLLLLSLHCV